MATAENMETVSTETGMADGDPLPYAGLFKIASLEPGGEARMSCSGQHAINFFLESTGEPNLQHFLADTLVGYDVRVNVRGQLIWDEHLGKHRWAPPHVMLIRQYFGPFIFHTVFDCPGYHIIVIK